MKASINGLCHMIKMAAMPIYAKKKNFQNLLLWKRKADELVTWYVASSTTKFVSNDAPGLSLIYFTACQMWSPLLLYGKS